MIEFIVLIFTVAVFLYALLAGADFGAGILELLPLGISREERTRLIGKAMGPVWEANHIWLILALVIAFNGFPDLFWFVSEWFHFPLGAFVMGVIFRGASFTFLHYDPIKDGSQKVYHWIFGLSSIWCTLWIGIMVGSLMLGNFSLEDTAVWERYFGHWLNPFCLLMGLFITVLSMFNASLFLYVEEEINREPWRRVTVKVFILMIVVGFFTHASFFLQDPMRWKLFFFNYMSIGLITLSFLLLFPQYWLIQHGHRQTSRLMAGVQLAAIMGAGFIPLFPDVVLFRDGNSLSFYETAAEPGVLSPLMYALILGCLFILPSYFYLMRIFKLKQEQTTNDVT